VAGKQPASLADNTTVQRLIFCDNRSTSATNLEPLQKGG
jgi:hypothetical protein